MKVERKTMMMNGSFYIPMSPEHAAHLGVDEKHLEIIIEDFVKSKGPFIAVYKKE